ncbi:N-acetylmuramoyl-L-alanine amidase [Desulforamulus ruminis]|uniref:N-acetylmuramoyl-L-alanine amidase n=1 Tax=Desulforamulus ruminis TaxID=1564 RepID=UPI002356C5C0|nr:N-acetylmuramoyl-L-alanine amidase [Desulforamulus ruminis]
MLSDFFGNRVVRYAILVGLGLGLLVNPMMDGKQAEAAQVATASVDKLNLRSGPGTQNGLVGQVNKGERLAVLSKSGDWYQVQVAGKTAWVAGWLVKVQEVTTPSRGAVGTAGKTVAVVNTGLLNVRSGPGTGYGLVGTLKQGTSLTILEQSGDWRKIQSGNTTGWVASWLITTPTTTTPAASETAAGGGQLAVVNVDNLNLRSGPGTQHSVAGQVSRGVSLPVVSRSGDWVQVRQNNGSTAWVAGWMVSTVNQPEPAQPPSSEQNGWLPTESETRPGQNDTPGTAEYVPEAKVVAVQVSEKDDHTYVNITSDHQLEYNTFTLSNPFRYVVNLKDVHWDQIPETLKESTALVDKVRTGVFSQDPYIARLVLDLKQGAKVKVSLSADKQTLTLDISKISYSDGLQGKTVFLDAGHGGSDPGASGASGLREKDVNLKITLKVAELLKQQGANVVFSRSNDIFVDLYERTRMANEQSADIFVSIHSNASTNPATAGTSTYFYAPTSNTALYEQYNDRKRLADDVQKELTAALGRRNIGVLQANFAVLRTSVMPSILVETAFLSNSEEEALLGSDDFQQRTAEAITKGISAYFSGK